MMGFSGREIILLALFSTVGFVNAKFAIVEPFPSNVYPVEYTSTQVTCVAYDNNDTSPVMPRAIQFMRKDKYAIYTNVTANENIFFTRRTEDNGRKLFVTIHIRNVTKNDDSNLGSLGRYECHAYAVGVSSKMKYGFAINVIDRKEIPQVAVSKVDILQHGDEVNLKCNVTDGMQGQSTNTLERISWFKDGILIQSVEKPNPAEPKDTLGPLVIKNAGVKDGGNYTCLLEVLLRQEKGYNVSDTTHVKIAPWFMQEEGESKAMKIEQNVTLECSARGFPLNVEWKVMKGENETVTPCVDSSTDKRYKMGRQGVNDSYFMTITNLNTNDVGNYYCCLPSNCSANVVENRCQRFALDVTDPDVVSDATMALASHAFVLAVAFSVLRYHF